MGVEAQGDAEKVNVLVDVVQHQAKYFLKTFNVKGNAIDIKS